MAKYIRTATPAREKKAILVRLEEDLDTRVKKFKSSNSDLTTDQSAAIALFEYGLAAFERGEFVPSRQSVLSK